MKEPSAAHVFMGGTFDPVHLGHVRGALAVSELLNAPVHLMPAKTPVHKSNPSTSKEQRVAMLKLAVAPFSEIKVDLREINAASKSYTIETLTRLREELGSDIPLIMVIGMDSFVTLPRWREADEFLALCHILVLQRPQYQKVADGAHARLLSAMTENAKLLTESHAGHLFFFDQVPVDISASDIRRKIQHGEACHWLPQKVADYIGSNSLYQKL